MRLFVTVGLEAYPFDRLVAAIEDASSAGLLGSGTFVQYGTATIALDSTPGTAFLGYPEMLEHIARCDAVVAHAGVGTVLACREHGKTPVLVPREHERGEHVDDHQIELADALEREGLAFVARGSGAVLRDEILRLAHMAGAMARSATDDPTPGAALTEHLAQLLAPLASGRR